MTKTVQRVNAKGLPINITTISDGVRQWKIHWEYLAFEYSRDTQIFLIQDKVRVWDVQGDLTETKAFMRAFALFLKEHGLAESKIEVYDAPHKIGFLVPLV